MKKLIVFSRDPAPTERLIAVVERLRLAPMGNEAPGFLQLRDDFDSACQDIEIVSRRPGFDMWRAAGFSPVMWQGRDDAAAARLLRDEDAAMVMTGTSAADEPGDWLLWRAARAKGIASHGVLDQRLALEQRFADAAGRTVYPDFVYVPDVDFATAIAQIGLPRHSIRILGELHVERLRQLMDAVPADEVYALRSAWGVPAGRHIVLFASEKVCEMTGEIGVAYDETGEIDRLIANLESGAFLPLLGVDPREICLVVRPHPRAASGQHSDYAGERASGLIVVVSGTGPLQTVLKAADTFVGMNSSLLHFAKICGRPAISLTHHPLGEEPGATR